MMEASPDGSARELAGTPEPPGGPERRLRTGLPLNLRGGLKLLLLQRRAPAAFAGSFDQLLALLLLNLLLWVGLETLYADADTILGLDAFYGLGCYLLLGLFGCALVARLNSREANTRALLVPLLSVAPYVLILFWLGADLAQRYAPASVTLALGVGLLYLALLGVRVLQAAYGSLRMVAGLGAVLLIVASPVVLTALNLDTQLWIANQTNDSSDQDESVVEPLLYEQPRRIAQAVERAVPQQRVSPAVYVVGFAGDDQDVFKREALLAGQVLSSHFGSADRALQLINDVQDRDTYPLATVTGLERALKLLASRMDRARDVLVLALTSHGSEDGLEVSNGNLPLLQLEPADLRQMLDDSGIKWRVVIVSACFAGVFVEPLKSDTTLVITAADAEHSSFGCEDDRELTYFGEAFLKEAVPSTDSLEVAFSKAAAVLYAREIVEHKPHSNPQMYVGKLMREKLKPLERPAHVHDAQWVTSR